MKIILIGMPASGKSTCGNLWSNILHLPFIDLDQEITLYTQQSIDSLFTHKGEDYFRQVEHQVFKQLLLVKETFVVATGGGTPCFYNNLKYIHQAGISVFLDTPIGTIKERVIADSIDRPLFRGLSPDDIMIKLMELYQQRLDYYQQATYRITTASDEDNILSHLKKLLGS